MEKRDAHVILETPRLVLRQFTAGDVDNLFALDSDPQVTRYLTGGQPTPRERIRNEIIPFHLARYERDQFGHWAVESAASGAFLGWFHFRPGHAAPDDLTSIELGYRLRQSTWNQGYATEGSRALIDLGFTALGVQRVFAHDDGQRPVPAGHGEVRPDPGPHFSYEHGCPVEGAGQGEVEYALTKAEWENR